MKLDRYSMAAIKKTAQIIKPKRAKICKLLAKREEINMQIDALQSEIDLWEAPIITKHGYSSEQILSGEADEIASQTESMSWVPVETVDDTEEEEAADMQAGHTSTSVDENPEL